MILTEKLHVIKNAQKNVLVQRDEEIDGVWLTLLAGEHGFFYGPPGVAKSLIVADIGRYFPSFEYFYHLMGKHTVPEELFGPISITAMRQDKLLHQIDQYLPTASLAFLDEGFKANGALLNSLLMVMNERIYRHGTEMLQLPLKSLFIASNEIPTEPELGALYDRILFRFNVQDLNRSEDFLTLLTQEQEIKKFLSDPAVETFTAKEFQTLREMVNTVYIPHEVLKAVVHIRDSLHMEHQIVASSRRWLRTLQGVRAHAVLHGRTEAIVGDLLPLVHMLWNQVDEIPQVKEVVWAISNPTRFILQRIRDDLTAVLADMREAVIRAQGDDTQNAMILAEYGTKLQEIQGDIGTAHLIMPQSEREKYEAKFQYMTSVIASAKVTLLVDVGGIDPAAAGQTTIVEWKPETI